MSTSSSSVIVRGMTEDDLTDADRIMRQAFGTYLGMPDPLAFMGDAAYVSHRWHADPSAAFSADVDGTLAGSNFATTWGSFGFFGPLSVHPDFWQRGVAKPLIAAVLDCFQTRGVISSGLYTFANSGKHVALYQKFGYWPQHLIALISRPVKRAEARPITTFSSMRSEERSALLSEMRALTSSIHDGLDVTSEVTSVEAQRLGDTVTVFDGSSLAGFAICHDGPGTEAGTGTCYMKFGAVRSGQSSPTQFENLLSACDGYALSRGATKLTGGVNTARELVYRQILASGFTIDRLGVSMVRPADGGYNRRDAFVVDDWR
ncbi:MAG: GNAT family N-acetyltransferase [Gemmatimonadaceae bacterium]